MDRDFAAAMARATEATRASNLEEATRIIREALGLRGAQPPAASALAEIPIPAMAPAASPGAAERPGPAPQPSLRFGQRLRRPLREAVRLLRDGKLAFRARMPAREAPSAPPVPAGARFEARHFACEAGERDYKLYVPSCDGAPRGLVLMLHGCKQDPDDFAAGTGMNQAAEAEGLLVAYPRQASAHNLASCWNWFRPGDQRRDAGEPAILAGLTRALVAEFGLDPEHVFVAGLSAGGAMAAVLAETYPDLYAAAGIHSGLPTGAANDVVSAFAVMRGEPGLAAGSPTAAGRLIVFHGEADQVVHPANAERIIAGRAGTPTASQGRSAGGRTYRRLADGDTEVWIVEGAGHAWAGGRPEGSYADPAGPDASAEMVRFFLRR